MSGKKSTSQQGERLVIEDFTPGVRADMDPIRIPRGGCTAARSSAGALSGSWNVIPDRGALRIRPGRALLGRTSATYGNRAMAEFLTIAATNSGAHLALANGTSVLVSSPNDPTTFSASGIALTNAAAYVRMAGMNGQLFVCDGIAKVKTWDPINGAQALTTLAAPSQAPILSMQPETTDILNIIGGDFGGITNYTWTAATGDMAGTHLNMTNVTGANYEVQIPGSIDETKNWGATLRAVALSTANNWPASGTGYVLEAVGTWSGSGPQTGLNICLITICDSAGNPTSLDLSTATELIFEHAVTVGVTTPPIYPVCSILFATEFPENQTLPTWNASQVLDLTGNDSLDHSGSYGLLNGSPGTTRVDISTVAASLGNVKYLGLQMDCSAVTTPGARVELPTSGNAGFDSDTYFYAAAFHPDPAHTNYGGACASATSWTIQSISADKGGTQFVAGDLYNVTYTWVYDGTETDGVLSTNAVESGPYTTDTSITMPVNQSEVGQVMTVECFIDAGVTPVPQQVNLYANGGALGTQYLQVATLPYTGSGAGNVTFEWNGAIASQETIVLQQYVGAPPVGAALLATYKGRMLYGAAPAPADDVDNLGYNTLWISDFNDPANVPGENYTATPPGVGGWMVVSADGAPITALGTWGSYEIVCTTKEAYQLSGEMAEDFTLMLVSAAAGCLNHETMHCAGDSLTVWLGFNKVWGWTPDGIVDIGTHISPLLRTYTLAEQQQAVACHDRDRGWYILTMPDGISFVLYGMAREEIDGIVQPVGLWAVWQGLPTGCMTYAHHLPTPGLYASDATGNVYQLNTGTVDAGGAVSYLTWQWSGTCETVPDPQQAKSCRQMVVYRGQFPAEEDEQVLNDVYLQLSLPTPNAGATTGLTAPAWPTAAGSSVQDHDLTWTEQGSDAGITATWLAGATFVAGAVISGGNGHQYVATPLPQVSIDNPVTTNFGVTANMLPLDFARNLARWVLPHFTPATSLQVVIGGVTDTGGLVTAITLDVVPRGVR